jgi:hypothetical protein
VVRPERRTRADLVAGTLIVVVSVVVTFLVWWNSDARATVSDVASPPLETPAPVRSPPATLTQAWQASSPATPTPVVAGPAVVTGDGDAVLGRDPRTGKVRWSYSRNIPLCTIGSAWGRAISVFRKWHNCSEVSSLVGSTGVRGPQSNTDAEFGTRLLFDGYYVTATGRRDVESWRSDLVRTQQYGEPVDIIYSNNNMRRPNCWYSSVAVGDGQVAVIENCPGDPGQRVSVIEADPSNEQVPEQAMSTVVGGRQASVVAVTNQEVAVVRRDTSQLVVYNFAGTVQGTYRLPLGQAPATGPTTIEPTTAGDGLLYWYTGSATVALNPDTLIPVWTARGTLGPGTLFGGSLAVPVPAGVALYNPFTGAPQRVIPVNRNGYSGPILSTAIGGTLLEQRGTTLVALH